MTRFPFYTLLIGLFCIIVYSSALLSSLFIYHRDLIMQGEVWRLFSSIFVHLSLSHLMYSIISFIVLSYYIEQKNIGILLFILVSMVLLNGVFLFYMEENMLYYAGISGINYALFFYIGLSFPYASLFWKRIGQLILMLIVLKLFMELYGFSFTIEYLDKQSFLISSLSHALGVFTAVIAYTFQKRKG